MEKVSTFIESGIIEAYVMGASTPEESLLVEEMAGAFIEVREEIASVSEALELYAYENAIAPRPTLKPFIMATIDFAERVKSGEPASNPPELQQQVTAADFATWINREDMQLPGEVHDIYAKIIAYTPKIMTAIVWINEMAPQEVHHDEYEKFLILEGTCTITIEHTVHHLAAGSFLEIPLHKKHLVKVTSSIPCKLILQRIAA